VSETRETVVVESEGFTVAKIVWRRFRRPMTGLVERVLDENPGLSATAELAVGTRFSLPAPERREPAERRAVRLW
jgi:phage tail protein X